MKAIVDWESHVEDLVEEEAARVWHPFYDRYVNTRISHEVGIPQISTSDPVIQIICKLSENLSVTEHYEMDEDALPPKVLCWNDISTVDSKTANKIIKAGIEKEYSHLTESFSISFQPVSIGNADPIPITNDDYQQLIYHIIDPTIGTSQKMSAKPTGLSIKGLSKSTMNLHELSKKPYKPQLDTVMQSNPIQDDPEALKRIIGQIKDNSIFIIDTNYAKNVADILHKEDQTAIIFGATTEALHYTPQLPLDLFTSCLLTPASVALLWQSKDYSDIKSGVLTDYDIVSLIEKIHDAKISNPIIEMIEICLQACVDQMVFKAFEEMPERFYKSFRATPLMSKLCTNFIFATRVLKSYSMSPFSYPDFPDLSQHPLWASFDVHVDEALYGLLAAAKPSPTSDVSFDTVLQEQLTLLENWLCFPSKKRPPPGEFQYIAPLLAYPKFFNKTIKICSKFLRISRKFVVGFLSTKAFSALTTIINDKKRVSEMSEDTAADFSYVVLNCLLVSPPLKSFFENHVDFWIERVHSENKELRTVSLGCLLLFSESEGKVDLYIKSELNKFIENLIHSESVRQRALAHLLLSMMHEDFTFKHEDLLKENSPLVRASMVSQLRTLHEKKTDISEDELDQVFVSLLDGCNDLDPVVREESLVSMSHIIFHNPLRYIIQLENFPEFISNENENYATTAVMCYQIQTMCFDPSVRVCERLLEFMQFIDSLMSDDARKIAQDKVPSRLKPPNERPNKIRFSGKLSTKETTQNNNNQANNIRFTFNTKTAEEPEKPKEKKTRFSFSKTAKDAVPPPPVVRRYIKKRAAVMQSNLITTLLNTVARSLESSIEPLAFSECTLENSHSASKLVGFPTISPSGLLSCADETGNIHIQTSSNIVKGHRVFDFFAPHISKEGMPPAMFPMFKSRKEYKENVVFNDFIDDYHLLAVSGRSQVVVVDTQSIEPNCAFWMSAPDINRAIIVDYNNRDYKILHYHSAANVSIFDLNTLQKSQVISIDYSKTENVEWLKPYSTLFYVAQQDLKIFDTRMAELAATIKGVGPEILSCNASGSAPFSLIAGYKNGNVSLFDMRTMSEEVSYNIECPLKQFDVHKYLPYSVGIADTLVSFSTDSGTLEMKRHKLNVMPESFALHPNENVCAVRLSNKVQTIFIDYEN